MKVFVDSNILYNDPKLEGPRLLSILKVIARLNGSLYISEVVTDELAKKRLEDIRKLRDEMELCADKIALHAGDIEKVVLELSDDKLNLKKYQEYYRTRVSDIGAELTDYPDISHKDLVERASLTLKPFDSGGQKGYRDTLIWASWIRQIEILENKGNKHHYYLITNNSKDFSDVNDKNKLDSHLIEELISIGIGVERIHYYSHVDRFIQDWIDENLDKPEPAGLNTRDGCLRFLRSIMNNAEFKETMLALEPLVVKSIQRIELHDFEEIGSSRLKNDRELVRVEGSCEIKGLVVDTCESTRIWHERFRLSQVYYKKDKVLIGWNLSRRIQGKLIRNDGVIENKSLYEDPTDFGVKKAFMEDLNNEMISYNVVIEGWELHSLNGKILLLGEPPVMGGHPGRRTCNLNDSEVKEIIEKFRVLRPKLPAVNWKDS